jgi:hypothetical protein
VFACTLLLNRSVHVKLNSGLSWQNSIQQEEDSFNQQIGLKLVKCYIWSIAFYGRSGIPVKL